MTQDELWQQVNEIKQRVIDAAGGDLSALSHAFRASEAFLGYIAMCGEAQVDYEEGELGEKVLSLLKTYAERVMAMLAEGRH